MWLSVPDPIIDIPSFISSSTNDTISLSCAVRVGLGASVYWIDPNNTIIDENDRTTIESSSDWLSVYVESRNETTDDQYQIIAHRTLIISDFIDSLDDVVGVYKCIVSDPGYQEKRVFEEYSVTLTDLVSSTEAPSVSTSSLQTLSSSLLMTSSSPVSSPPPLPSSKPLINDNHIVILTLSSVFITIVLIVFSLVIATFMYCRHKSVTATYIPTIRKVPAPPVTMKGVATGGGTAGAGSVQVLAKGLMAPTSFMFFPKFDMSEREVSRQHLVLIDKLGKRERGEERERGGEKEGPNDCMVWSIKRIMCTCTCGKNESMLY